ncbi:MAG TPA: metallophosphoesterase family protein [Vicinamibacterales bacterium]|nr:metallophosphoesterase family protein [Vicinamibacterales bacterium]
MRYLVLSDIHANMEAFEAVLAVAAEIGYDRLLVLGDLVGYGGDPNAVVEKVRALAPYALIRGNHDKVGSGVESADGFNAVARSAIRWTYEALTSENREWLAALPAGPMEVDDLIEICHGTPFDEDAYVFDDLDALRALHSAERPLCLFGHTHVQVGYALTGDQFAVTTLDDQRPLTIALSGTTSHLINPGSVGQPRDGDPRAGFSIVDTDTTIVTIYRTPYPVEQAQARILEQGLPEVLAQRLALGR